ncbi:efflux RND transporter permease subunit [Parasulfuritortus cantonensis]|uniref:Efflux RND transporter permease subunit n=1 Tax=Parasulfuritortus cantonensis TaxID=2528202 RepID=A0A4R1B8Y3_9PROT|nr:efflux RND transporter permease subunit [Parasulfuritortus cantonensis]TCJ13445.1 efflux RND transporter permease subunit [Parasulfuritortus cantonensis]
MTGFNLSDWALRHRALMGYFMVVLALMGVYGYRHLGQAEDPAFTFKLMVVQTKWPGASAQEVEEQVTDRIEKKLQEVPYVDRITSFSRPGESTVMFLAHESTPPKAVPDIFYQVRKKIGDIRQNLPAGIQGPFFNDEFGDVFGNIYAITGPGLSYAQLKDYADDVRDALLRVPDVAKVDLYGVQDERIHIDIDNARLATLGVDLNSLAQALAQQNALAESGFFETGTERIYVRASGPFDTVQAVRDTVIRVGGRSFRIGDIARVSRGYAEPPQPAMRHQGQPAVGVGVTMAKGGDIILLGEHLDAKIAELRSRLPLGVEINRVADQPEVVRFSIRSFVQSLAEAVSVVLLVSFISLGFRTGMVVALTIPLVLAVTFFVMWQTDTGLHKVSLGALILALGLLVDDAIIAVEMMWVKMEQGWERTRAASFAYVSTAGPMLAGTLVTVAGFLPIAIAKSVVGEYAFAFFSVNATALLLSWLSAVLVVPFLGYKLLPDPHAPKSHGWLATRRYALMRRLGFAGERPAGPVEEGGHDVYDTPFYHRLRRLIDWCVAHRWIVIAATVLLFVVAVNGMKIVQKQFFPSSVRLELVLDLRLPQGASLKAVDTEVRKLERILAADPGVEHYTAYVGWGSPRFYLSLDQQLPAANFGQFMVMTKSIADREAVRQRLIKRFDEDFHGLRGAVFRVENGPPVGFPVQFRVSGADIPTLRRLAHQVADVMRKNPYVSNVQFDWDEQSKIVRVVIDQDKARLLGVSSQDLAAFLNATLTGTAATAYREADRIVNVELRGAEADRDQLSRLADLAVPTRVGKSVPLAQVASLEYAFEPGMIWRRNRLPTITVRANVYDPAIEPATVTAEILPRLEPLRAALPAGFLLETGGSVEESGKAQRAVFAGIPFFVAVVLTVLMIQLQNFPRVIMVVLTAPLGIIGVAAFLLLFGKPFGFMALLGVIAMLGMIMRNSVILIDQIDQDLVAGKSCWEAIVGSAVRRFRPIVLTASAAVLAMIPLSRNVFFGPMAVSIMGGLIIATLLTMLFLPALYAAWYRVRRE